MRYLLPILLVSILHCTFAAQLHILNNCSETVNICGIIMGCITTLGAGQEYTYELSTRTHITFTNGEDGLTAATFGIEYKSYKVLDDFYSVNIAAGFDTGVQITSKKSGGVITCTKADCFSGQKDKMDHVPTGGDFSLTYCPSD